MSAPTSTGRWRVSAIRYASRPTSRADVFYRYQEYGKPDGPQEMAYYIWLLQNDTQTILVDTGFSMRGGDRRGRSYMIPPLEALAGMGVTPQTVDRLVVTHLHYDHTGHLDEFRDVPMVVTRLEVETWSSSVAGRTQFAAHIEPSEIAVLLECIRAGSVEVFEGELEIAPGVLGIEVGGHSPGQMILRVESESGPVVLASDAAHFYEEVEQDMACAVLVDLEKVYGAYDRIRNLLNEPGARFVPGHDPLVMERFNRRSGAAEGFAVSI